MIAQLAGQSSVRLPVGLTGESVSQEERLGCDLEQGFTVFCWEEPQRKYFWIFGPSGL